MYNENNNGCSRGSLICSIVSFFIFPFIFGIIGVVLGIIGISNQEDKQGLAIAGIIIGIISVLYAFYVYGGNIL